jgi:flagellar motor protein MotB
MRFIRQKQQSSEENHFWISISDLMTTLLFVFILILAVTILDLQTDHISKEEYEQVKLERDAAIKENKELQKLIKSLVIERDIFKKKIEVALKEKKEIEKKYNDLKEKIKKLLNKNRNARTELLLQLKQRLAMKNINVEIVPEEGVMRITKERLFDTAKAEVKDKKLIKAVTKELLTLLEDDKYREAINTIYIEGHTDSDPLNRKRCGVAWTNKELSAQRAINTFSLMKSYAEEQQLNFEDRLFSYSGYADSRPIKGTSNKNEEEKARNRRIQFFFALNPPKVKSIEELEK